MSKTPVLLDCTLRDGGYYNHWDFPKSLVERYLSAVARSGINTVEIGFRFLPQKRFLGAFAYSTDQYLRTLAIPDGITIGVMINAKEFIEHPEGATAMIDGTFTAAQQSPVGLVRVAVHVGEVPRCEMIIRRLKDLGYRTGLNIMQVGSAQPDDLESAIDSLQDWPLDVLYFADSLGNMDRAQVIDTVSIFKRAWPGPIGIHPHNNMARAVDNALTALEAGVDWVDATICGMGRGAGNAQTEHLVVEFSQKGLGYFKPDHLFNLVLRDFEPLKAKFGWGPSMLYYLSAAYAIHPTYVQEMLTGSQDPSGQILEALQDLRYQGGATFNPSRLQHAIEVDEYCDYEGSWNASNWLKDQNVLLVGQGPSAITHRDGLRAFAKARNAKILSLNLFDGLAPDEIDAYIFCHPVRINGTLRALSGTGATIIAPSGALVGGVEGINLLDYGLKIENACFEPEPNRARVSRRNVAAYAFALLVMAAPKHIFLAGFDGYDPHDPRQTFNEWIINAFIKRIGFDHVTAVTPTQYALAQGSLYAPYP